MQRRRWLAGTATALADGADVTTAGERTEPNSERDGPASDAAVVVGVDGSTTATRAVEWAAVEAELRRMPLTIVHAIDPRDGSAALPAGPQRESTAAYRIFADASDVARRAAPDVTIRREVVRAAPVDALLGTGETAMLCLGSDRTVTARPGHRARTATEVLLHAAVPVALIRAGTMVDGWVVTEITAEPSAADVLRAAVKEAVLRRRPLRVILGSTDSATNVVAHVALRERAQRDIAEAAERFPGLDVAVLPTGWTIGEFLRSHRPKIGLFVAAPAYRQEVGQLLHASAAAALRLLECPVLIIHRGGTHDG